MRGSGEAAPSPADRHSSSSAAADDAVRGRDSPKALGATRNQSHPDLCHPALHRVSDTSSTGTRKTSAGASGAGGSGGAVTASNGSEDLQAWLAVGDPSGQRKAVGGQRAAAAAAAGFAAAAAAAAAEQEDDDVRISKRAQWEHEVFEELARHRLEHRAGRGALGSLPGQ